MDLALQCMNDEALSTLVANTPGGLTALADLLLSSNTMPVVRMAAAAAFWAVICGTDQARQERMAVVLLKAAAAGSEAAREAAVAEAVVCTMLARLEPDATAAQQHRALEVLWEFGCEGSTGAGLQRATRQSIAGDARRLLVLVRTGQRITLPDCSRKRAQALLAACAR
jgi:hypothetical protein